MKYLITIVSLIFFFNLKDSYSADSSSLKFFPLNVGDKFIYYFERFINHPPSYTRYYVIGELKRDSIINSKRYIFCEGIPSFKQLWLRVDSIENVYAFDPSNHCSFYHNEDRLDSLSANKNDTIKNCIGSQSVYKCIEFGNHTIFGNNTLRKVFYSIQFFANGASTMNKQFSKNFGLTYFRTTLTSGIYQLEETYNLKGCVINGSVYGDTNIVSINESFTEYPSNIHLYQNFPNPFNPSTTITYDLIKRDFVSLKIFNLLGKELLTVVNKEQDPGIYTLNFDGTNFSGGIYFYRIETKNFTDTKKMMLLK
ncbi:MAG TPA: T9SS type A sorting domain-containing protein [Ignavibacteria bacterium]|nr:T9SS type A sorting domain-containing protein [Ignavibacteria bacterium]